MRECFSCGSIKTYMNKGRYEHWYRNKPFEQWLCEDCNNKYIKHPKWNPIMNPIYNKKWNPINGPKHILYKNKSIVLGHNPRTGICSICGKKGRTNMHHIEYHDDDPLRDTIEVCTICHLHRLHQGYKNLRGYNGDDSKYIRK